MLRISVQNFYKGLFVTILVALYLVNSFEFSYIVTALFSIWLLFGIRLGKSAFEVLFLLTAIFLIALFGSFFQKTVPFEYLKGVLYFTKPILMVLLGYGFIQKIGSRDFFFKVIIYFAVFLAVYHIYLVVIWILDHPLNINRLRVYAGRGDVIELFGFIFIFCRKKLQINFRRRSYVNIAVVLLTISFLLYFSRTQAVAAIVIISSIYGYTKLNKKAIIVLSTFIVLAGGFFWYLNKIEIPRNAEGLEGFLYKIKIAPKEMFSTDIDVNNRAELWDKWRSYEAKMAIEQVLEDRPYILIFGKGIGALVDLKDDFMLNGKLERKIPTIHNGYAFVFFKSGILGLSLYLFVVLILYLKAYSLKRANAISIVTNNLLSGFGLYLMFTTLVVAGLYNTNSTVPLILGFILGVEHLNNLSVNEDSDNRN